MRPRKILDADADRRSTERCPQQRGTLIIDLDEDLVQTDLLYETFWSALSRDPAAALMALPKVLGGRAALREALARRVPLDPATLPYSEEILRLLTNWRAKGGRTALFAASDRGLALAVAGHLGLFDEVRASGTASFEGARQSNLPLERFGDGDYHDPADVPADLAAWRNARRAGDAKAGDDPRHNATRRSRPADHLRAMRPHQWLKNILIFVPAFAAHDLSPQTLLLSALAFVSLSLIASGTYILNDLLDLAADRAHPRKRSRPLACGAVSLLHGSVMFPVLVATGMVAALATGKLAVAGLMGVYLALTVAYSVALKRHLVIDVCTLAGLYTIRIIVGGVAAGVPLSVWMLAFSIFIFLCLAAVKRQAELKSGLPDGRTTASGRAYESDDLPIMAMMSIAAGYVAVLIVALYIDSANIRPLYDTPELLWGICPVLLYWISRMVMITHRGRMHDDPIVFAMRDKVSLICAALIAALAVGAAV